MRSDRRGVALMLVLWIVVVLSALALSVGALSRGETNAVLTLRSRAVARYAAESGIVFAKSELRSIFGTSEGAEDLAKGFERFRSRLEDMGEQRIGAGRFQVTAVDLSGRIDLNSSSPPTLRNLFEQFYGAQRAEELLARLEDWKDADEVPREGGAEAADYAAAASPFVPTNRPLRRLVELSRLIGFDDSTLSLLAPHLTVRGGGPINVNTASEEVLAALPGGQALLDERSRAGVIVSMLEARKLVAKRGGAEAWMLPAISTLPSRVLVISRGWEDGRPLTHEIQAVFELGGITASDAPQIDLVGWEERDL